MAIPSRDRCVEIPCAFAPIIANTRTVHRPVGPLAYDCVKIIVVRDGSAILFSEFGQKPVKVGDVIVLGANTLCGSEPEGHITVTTIYADTDYVIDQVFWQHVGFLQDRLDALEFAATIYTEPAQILRLGEDRAGQLMPWLDELVALSIEARPVENFHRMQAQFDQLMAADTQELARLAADRDRLDHERVKLLQAHYADAVPLDLLKQEQARIGAELETINNRIAAHHDEYAAARANLEDSIGLLANVAGIYRRCDDANRRLCNQAFFTAIYLDDDGEPRVTYQQPYDALCDPEVQANALNWAAETQKSDEVQTRTGAVPPVKGLNLATSG